MRHFVLWIGLISAVAQSYQDLPADLLNDTLGRVGNEVVTVKDFLSIYDKSSFNDPNRYTYESLREYWDLYANFRRKVQEAHALGIDTLAKVRKELGIYEDQLARMYINDRLLIDSLVEEAYQRLRKNVLISYIYLKGKNEDSLRQVAQALLRQLRQGADFAQLARQYSADTISAARGGRLGWFTAFQLPYEIEDAIYRAQPGDIVGPFSVRQGLVIIRVDSFRPDPGRMLTAHIFIKVPPKASPEQWQQAEKRAQEIYQQLQQGTSFEELAQRYSEDPSTAPRGGRYRWFATGETLPEYEEAAFALKQDGQISPPVRTPRGFYIIKRLGHQPTPSREELLPILKEQVRRDRQRLQRARQRLLAHFRQQWGFKERPFALRYFIRKADDSLTYRQPDEASCQRFCFRKLTLFKLAGKKYRVKDFCEYVVQRWRPLKNWDKERAIRFYYNEYVNHVTEQELRRRLPVVFPEYARLMKEYRDGVILFEIMDQKVWQRAARDSAGLARFFEQEKAQRGWLRKARVVYWYGDSALIQEVKALLTQHPDLSADSIRSLLVPKGLIYYSQTVVKPGEDSLVNPNVVQARQLIGPYRQNDRWMLIHVVAVEPLTLDDIRGRVVAAYQQYLETQWLKELQRKYPATLNEEVLRRISRAMGKSE